MGAANGLAGYLKLSAWLHPQWISLSSNGYL